ncbi:EamA family transporter [Cohaesibacter gelatinilyticus]|mgnify:CR=1 FL=1|uniref:Uncharacterized membrane protein n=1 Tax=Cohaesibacter gelatinilyticus TaxID=372072 RepID=A0A285PET0_9HYPH|nr:EamA family transporter [Cohaesibacter gelatinilyticus]SNZ20225.1 Uncharacterized membrane protein [Cohaesibacter gelatinilyticus]
MGELLAILSAAFYGLAGVTIAKGRHDSKGDNGVFLSVVVTALLSFFLWKGSEATQQNVIAQEIWIVAVMLFAAAGLFSTVLGRITMYRSTELIGSVGASMTRRLIPIFAIPISILLIREWPVSNDLVGGLLIFFGVFVFCARRGQLELSKGLLLGIASAACYALSYVLRRAGLEDLADPAFATFIGAATGLLVFLGLALVANNPREKLHYMTIDRGIWPLCTATSLAIGQTLQLYALQTASVAIVAFIGSIDILFTTLFAALLMGDKNIRSLRFLLAILFVLAGSAFLV